jgi:hypothetical protein
MAQSKNSRAKLKGRRKCISHPSKYRQKTIKQQNRLIMQVILAGARYNSPPHDRTP